MKFAKRGDCNIIKQDYDKEKITVTKGGKTYNQYDAIQAANIDTDINEVMVKYHCAKDQAVEFMKEKGGMQGIYTDFSQLQEKVQTTADLFALKKTADELFYNLPTKVREKYGNNLEEFFTDLQNKAKEIQEKKQEVKTNEDK